MRRERPLVLESQRRAFSSRYLLTSGYGHCSRPCAEQNGVEQDKKSVSQVMSPGWRRGFWCLNHNETSIIKVNVIARIECPSRAVHNEAEDWSIQSLAYSSALPKSATRKHRILQHSKGIVALRWVRSCSRGSDRLDDLTEDQAYASGTSKSCFIHAPKTSQSRYRMSSLPSLLTLSTLPPTLEIRLNIL